MIVYNSVEVMKMAIPVNIDDLINRRIVESTRIEFKEDLNPNPVIHSICAFANDIDNIGGGYIVLGVEEKDGSPVFPIKGIPQNKIDDILKKLVGYCHFIEPLYNPVVEPILYNDVYVIVIWVLGGHGRPYKASKDIFTDKSSKYYYIRKFSSTVIASPEEEKELFYLSSDIPFDDRPNLLAEVDDLDVGLMRGYLKEAGSNLYEQSINMTPLEIAKDMHLVSGPVERIKPLNVGILMFSERPEKYFRYARIEVVDLPDPTGTKMSERTFTGPIQRQLRDALAFIKNYAIESVVIKDKDKAESERIYNYPYPAIEEILSNAVYHRSYQINEPITVRITPESIEIISYPGFDRSITDEDIRNYEIRGRIYKNRRIGDFLKELHLIEGRNTGFPTAFKALRENGSSLPTFLMGNQREFLSVTIHVHPYYLKSKESKAIKQDEYETRILDALVSGPKLLSELAVAMGYKGISKKLTNTVNSMLAEKKIKMVPYGVKSKISLNYED